MKAGEHEHTLDWATEGPLWFCACGAEFYPRRPAMSHPTTQRRGRVRVVLTIRAQRFYPRKHAEV